MENVSFMNNTKDKKPLNDPNCKTYTLMLINNLAKNTEYQSEFQKHSYDIQNYYSSMTPIKTPVGQLYQIKKSDIANNGWLRSQNKWFTIIVQCFEDIAGDAKFLELRPSSS